VAASYSRPKLWTGNAERLIVDSNHHAHDLPRGERRTGRAADNRRSSHLHISSPRRAVECVLVQERILVINPRAGDGTREQYPATGSRKNIARNAVSTIGPIAVPAGTAVELAAAHRSVAVRAAEAFYLSFEGRASS
jgi:hypothetical protein